MSFESRNILLKYMRKFANQGIAPQGENVSLSENEQAGASDQINDADSNQDPNTMMTQAEALAPLEVLANIYQEQAYIVQVLNQNANNIVNVLEPLTQSVNMLNQWLIEHQQHEELEDKAFRLQQLVAKQQSVGYNNQQQQPGSNGTQPQTQAQQAYPQTSYAPQLQEQQPPVPNSGMPGTQANYDERGITPPRGY